MSQPTFSDRIRDAIDRDGRSRNAICLASNIDRAAMSRFMHATAGLSTTSLDRLLPVLGLELKRRTLQDDTKERCEMSDEIHVTVCKWAEGRPLMLRWTDPVSGKRKTKSSGTTNQRKAERLAGELGAGIAVGQYAHSEPDNLGAVPGAIRA